MLVGRFAFEVTEAPAATLPPPVLNGPFINGPVINGPVGVVHTEVIDGPTPIDLSAFDISTADIATRTQVGDIALVAVSEDAGVLGAYWVCARMHRDTYFGQWSEPDHRFAYGHQLFVSPDGRGHGIATRLLLLGRHEANRRWGVGVRNMVAVENSASVRAHRRAGYHPVCTLQGIRFGPRTVRRVRSHA